MIKYRQDIDGLRSLAILPVLFFHLGAIRLFPGGFVGVDVFFVISGYLITKIIYDDLSNERYSIARFYERRIRRIVPALIPVYLFVCVGALLLYFPSEGREIGRTVVSSIFFVSNILFYAKSGYFDAGAKTSPLLHTWSLAVEEQFYLVFPLVLLLLLRRAPGRLELVLTLVAAASLDLADDAARLDLANTRWMISQQKTQSLLRHAKVASLLSKARWLDVKKSILPEHETGEPKKESKKTGICRDLWANSKPTWQRRLEGEFYSEKGLQEERDKLLCDLQQAQKICVDQVVFFTKSLGRLPWQA